MWRGYVIILEAAFRGGQGEFLDKDLGHVKLTSWVKVNWSWLRLCRVNKGCPYIKEVLAIGVVAVQLGSLQFLQLLDCDLMSALFFQLLFIYWLLRIRLCIELECHRVRAGIADTVVVVSAETWSLIFADEVVLFAYFQSAGITFVGAKSTLVLCWVSLRVLHVIRVSFELFNLVFSETLPLLFVVVVLILIRGLLNLIILAVQVTQFRVVYWLNQHILNGFLLLKQPSRSGLHPTFFHFLELVRGLLLYLLLDPVPFASRTFLCGATFLVSSRTRRLYVKLYDRPPWLKYDDILARGLLEVLVYIERYMKAALSSPYSSIDVPIDTLGNASRSNGMEIVDTPYATWERTIPFMFGSWYSRKSPVKGLTAKVTAFLAWSERFSATDNAFPLMLDNVTGLPGD